MSELFALIMTIQTPFSLLCIYLKHFCFQANAQLQQLEEERITKMNDFLNQYNSNVSVLAPKLAEVQ